MSEDAIGLFHHRRYGIAQRSGRLNGSFMKSTTVATIAAVPHALRHQRIVWNAAVGCLVCLIFGMRSIGGSLPDYSHPGRRLRF